MDILLVLLILPVATCLGALVYCWIQVVSSGPGLFKQSRVGRNGKAFTIYKFRTMDLDADTDFHINHMEHMVRSNSPMTKLDMIGDSRLIKGGFLIRSSGLDELPQLLNVLRGEMSWVGPRPCLPKEFALYEASQLHRFTVQPGLTGLWQVSRNQATTFTEMVGMDNHYVNNLTLVTDVYIILKTPIVLVGQITYCVKSEIRKAARRSGGNPISRKIGDQRNRGYDLSQAVAHLDSYHDSMKKSAPLTPGRHP